MAEIRFTKRQSDAVNVRGGDVLVSAAAGSGKTAVLTERVVKMLTDEKPIGADRLIIVTYTAAAAEEMRRRISDKLLEKIAENPDDDLLREQQMLLADAHISTIHALCLSLVKEHFQALNLSPNLKIADTARLNLIINEAAQEVIENAYEASDDEFLSLVEYTCVKNDKRLVELMISIYNYIRNLPFPKDFLSKSLKMYEDADGLYDNAWAEGMFEYAASGCNYAVEVITKALDESLADGTIYEKYSPALQDDLRIYKEIKAAFGEKDYQAAERLINSRSYARLAAIRGCENPDLAEKIKAYRETAKKLVNGIAERCFAVSPSDFQNDTATLIPKTARLFKLITELYDLTQEKKRAEELLDYSDMEHLTLELLIEKTENGYIKTAAGEELSSYFSQIMIDECQDINETQALIFESLSDGCKNLYMVGDVKQSIYRFRQAEPDTFIKKRENYAPYDECAHTETSREYITLDANFRSRAEVCHAVNHIFSRLMSKDAGEINYTEDEYLTVGAAYEAYDKAAPELHIVDLENSEETDKALCEGRYIANRINTLIAQGYTVKDKNGVRPCSYRDFAILGRSIKKSASGYAKALEEAGIPCVRQEARSYFDEYEIMVIINLLRVIDNPLSDIPLLSALMSPIFGFSPDEATEIRLAQRSAPLYTAMLKTDDAKCKNALAAIEFFREKAAIMSVSELIEEIYDYTDFIAISSVIGDNSGNGKNQAANLRLLLTYAQNYEAWGSGLSGFLRFIDRLSENGQSFSAANQSSQKSDSVTIMSVHSSKGLEFPICILADCCHPFNKRELNEAFYQIHPKLGFGMKIVESKKLKRYNSFPFEAIKLRRDKEGLAEEMRILYVALTRAKEKLIMVSSCDNVGKEVKKAASRFLTGEPTAFEVNLCGSFFEWIIGALLSHPDAAELRALAGRTDIVPKKADFPLEITIAAPPPPIVGERRGEESAAQPDKELSDELKRRFGFKYEYESAVTIPEKLTVTAIAKQSGDAKISLPEPPDFTDGERISPAKRGTVTHAFMQLADFSAAKADLQGEITRLTEREFISKADAKMLDIESLKAFFNSALCEKILAEETKREYKFNFFLKAGELDETLKPPFSEEEIFVQGIADCIIFEDDGMTLIDYKTDRSGENALKERYANQLRLYKTALEGIFEKRVKRSVIYSLFLKKEINL